jgi:hypothetical protein
MLIRIEKVTDRVRERKWDEKQQEQDVNGGADQTQTFWTNKSFK